MTGPAHGRRGHGKDGEVVPRQRANTNEKTIPYQSDSMDEEFKGGHFDQQENNSSMSHQDPTSEEERVLQLQIQLQEAYHTPSIAGHSQARGAQLVQSSYLEQCAVPKVHFAAEHSNLSAITNPRAILKVF